MEGIVKGLLIDETFVSADIKGVCKKLLLSK